MQLDFNPHEYKMLCTVANYYGQKPAPWVKDLVLAETLRRYRLVIRAGGVGWDGGVECSHPTPPAHPTPPPEEQDRTNP